MKHVRLILPLSFFALLFASCDKDNGASTKDTSGAASYNEQDWNWNKLPGGGITLTIDTAWDGDTTINF